MILTDLIYLFIGSLTSILWSERCAVVILEVVDGSAVFKPDDDVIKSCHSQRARQCLGLERRHILYVGDRLEFVSEIFQRPN